MRTGSSSDLLLGSRDDLGLLHRREIEEIGRIPRNPHDEIAIFLRVFLSREKRGFVDDVELDMPVFHLAPGPNDLHENARACFARDIGRAEFQVDEVAALLAIAPASGSAQKKLVA
jgi:hypothetical protein